MTSAFFDHRQNRNEDTTHRTDFLAASILCRGHGKKVPEQFIRAVNQVNIHEEAMLYEEAALCSGPASYSVRNDARHPFADEAQNKAQYVLTY
jgi:hypothetical protein